LVVFNIQGISDSCANNNVVRGFRLLWRKFNCLACSNIVSSLKIFMVNIYDKKMLAALLRIRFYPFLLLTALLNLASLSKF